MTYVQLENNLGRRIVKKPLEHDIYRKAGGEYELYARKGERLTLGQYMELTSLRNSFFRKED